MRDTGFSANWHQTVFSSIRKQAASHSRFDDMAVAVQEDMQQARIALFKFRSVVSVGIANAYETAVVLGTLDNYAYIAVQYGALLVCIDCN